MASVVLILDDSGMEAVRGYVEDLGRRMARAELLPILQEHFEPLVAMEQQILGPHSKSGALAMSLKARTSGRDYPGTMSVFSAPTATAKQLTKAWSAGRAQQRRWAKGIRPGAGRRSVFYGPFVEKGHRIVKRNADGQLYDTGKRAAPVHFAKGAVDALGEDQAEKAAEAIIKHIVG